MSAKLYAVTTEQKSPTQLAREAVSDYRNRLGSTVGDGDHHRGWPPDVVLAFMAASVIKPAAGEIQRKLYG